MNTTCHICTKYGQLGRCGWCSDTSTCMTINSDKRYWGPQNGTCSVFSQNVIRCAEKPGLNSSIEVCIAYATAYRGADTCKRWEIGGCICDYKDNIPCRCVP